MRKLLIISAFVAISGLLHGQNFGASYLAWVRNDAETQSREIATENFDLKIHQFYNYTYTYSYQKLFEIDSVITILEDSLYAQSARLDTINDELHRNYLRNYYATRNQALIFNLESRFVFLRSLIENADSLGTRKVFYQQALHATASSHLLESFAQIGNAASNFLPEKYPYAVGFYYSNDPNVRDATDVQQGQWATMLAGVGGALGSYFGPWGTLIGSSLGGLIGGYFDHDEAKKRMKEAQRKHDAQVAKLKEGNNLLPEKLLSPEAQYDIYSKLDSVYRTEFLEVKLNVLSHLDALESIYDELVVINISNKRAARSYLRKEQLKALKARFDLDAHKKEIEGYGEAIRFLALVSKDLNFARSKVEEISDSESFADQEQVLDLLSSTVGLLNYMISEKAYPLIEEELKAYVKGYEAEKELLLRGMQKNPSQELISVGFKQVKKEFTVPVSTSVYNFSLIGQETVTLDKLKSVNRSERSDDFHLVVCYNNSTYSLCSGGKYYGESLLHNGGANPTSSIMGSAYDGGYKRFSVEASADVEEAKRDVVDRVNQLRKEKGEFDPVAKEWRKQVVTLNKEPIVSPSRISNARSLREDISTSSSDQLKEYLKDLRQMASGDSGRLTYIQKQKRVGLVSNFTRDYPEQPVSSIASPIFEGHRSVKPREEALREQLGAEIRNAEALVNSGSHPTISSRDEYELLIQETELLHAFVITLIDNHYSASVISSYLDGLNAYRLYFKGYHVDISITNNQVRAGNEKLFNEARSSLSECVNANGRYNCQVDNGIMIQAATGKVSNSAMEPSIYGLGDANMRLISQETVSGNVLFLFNPDDTDQERYAIIQPGHYTRMDEIRVSYIDLNNPENSRYDTPIKDAFLNPEKLEVYRRADEHFYGNERIQSMSNSIYEHRCYSPDIGYYNCSSMRTAVRTAETDEGFYRRTEITELEGDYVNDIQRQFGNNSSALFMDIHSNIDQYFYMSSIDEGKLTPEYVELLNSVLEFDQSYFVEGQPVKLYSSQAMHNLMYITNEAINLTSDPNEINELVKESSMYMDMLLDIGTGVTPGVNDARDLYELLTGVDLITGEDIGILGRSLAAGGLIIGNGAIFRKILDAANSGATIGIIKTVTRNNGVKTLQLIRSGEFIGSSKTANGLIFERTRDGVDGNKNPFFHIMKHHHEWGRPGKINGGPSLKPSDYRWKTRFGMSGAEIVTKIDVGYGYVKAGSDRVIDVVQQGKNTRYLVEMPDVLGFKDGKPMKNMVIVIERRQNADLLVTAYPSL